nr:UvrD-helicase domain-containing protein [Ndongobacter massiliensis]
MLRVKFPFIFVYEFQDTNPIQTEIIKLQEVNLQKL